MYRECAEQVQLNSRLRTIVARKIPTQESAFKLVMLFKRIREAILKILKTQFHSNLAVRDQVKVGVALAVSYKRMSPFLIANCSVL